MSLSVSSLSTPADLLQAIESNEPEKWQEIKQLFYEQYQEVKESWLVQMLYEFYAQSGSPRCLELLLNVREPHDKFLCDKMAEGIKINQGKSRETALTMLGFIVRKQPSWLYKITQQTLMKELLKVLKHDEDLRVLMTALMDLLVLIPVVPVYIAPYLQDLFEIFSRIAAWRYQSIKGLPEVQQEHVRVGLYSFFHLLFGMFPCNFLSYLRVHYSENNRENHAVFIHTIKPMLNYVKMHPSLVTQTKEYEKTASRWKRMELHDIIVESSRYSLDSLINSKEEDVQPPPGLNELDLISLKSQSDSVGTSEILDSNWTPSRKCELNSPTPLSSVTQPPTAVTSAEPSKLNLESPPEAAIEATPETTPFVTPVKDEMFRFVRPQPSNAVSRQLNLDAKIKSPATASMTSIMSPASSKEPSPFRFPPNEGHHHQTLERRDSIFCGPGDIIKLIKTPSSIVSQDSHVFSTPNVNLTPCPTAEQGGHANVTSVAISSTALLGSASKPKPRATPTQLDAANIRPSPVKFTNQRPDQFPIKPEPERINPQAVADAMKHKMLSLEKLKELSDFGTKEDDDDDEVTEITGGNDDPGNHVLTRHITPKFLESGQTSRTLSSSSQHDPKVPMSPTITVTSAPSDPGNSREQRHQCQSGGVHMPSKEGLQEFVKQARRRIKYISVCGGSGGPGQDIAAEVASVMKATSPMSFMKARQKQTLKRANSCPDVRQIEEIVTANRNKAVNQNELQSASTSKAISTISEDNDEDETNGNGEDTIILSDKAANVSVQTDEFLVSPYEHLFPFVLPQWVSGGDSSTTHKTDHHFHVDNPYDVLDHYIQAAYQKASKEPVKSSPEQEIKSLKNEIVLLHNQLHYERHRREILGLRNRRLLGKTKSSRVLEEQNKSVNDRLSIASSEMTVLSNELEQLRFEKHETEVEHIRKEHERDLQTEALTKEKAELIQLKSELETKIQLQAEELTAANDENYRLEAALFRTKADVDRLEKKEDLRKITEDELIEARKEVVLLGELVRKYREKFMDKPVATEQERESLYRETYHQQIEAVNNELLMKASEVEALKARNVELEESQLRQEDAINAMKRQTKKICDQYDEQIRAVENAYESLKHSYVQLEVRTMELQSQLSMKQQMNRSASNSSMVMASSGRVGSASSRRRTSNAITANVDIELPANVMAGSGGIVDRSFLVGSPPSSSGGESLGSDHSERFRRALELGGIVQDGLVMNMSDNENRSPEVGSAVSALGAVASSGSSSMNGTKF